MTDRFNRRDFLKSAPLAGAGLTLGAMAMAADKERPRKFPPVTKAPRLEKVRMGFVGVGLQGSSHVGNFLKIDGVEVKAVCDIVPGKVKRIQKWVQDAGQPKPAAYDRGDWDFKRLCEREDLDLVFNAAPWRWHVPISVAAMENGKHAATEVPAALTLDECWRMVETSEKTRKYCVMMENCCYDRVELMILNMVRQGVLGELLHAECGYLHDLRFIKFENKDEGLWRRDHAKKRNGDLYPTHGLGPVAQCMNVNRGDRFDYLVSMSCNSRGLHEYAVRQFGPDSSRAKEKFALGDVVTTLIRTKLGRTIVVTYDTNLPRPYSRDILVQGTKGIVRKYPKVNIHIEGETPGHGWADAEELLPKLVEKYEHPLWKRAREQAKGAGHGGMDFIEDMRLIEALRSGTAPDADVYDAAAISAVSELSERSIAANGAPQSFPDFTRGLWKTNPPLGIIT